MAKKTQGTDTKQHDIAAPPENRPLDKSIVRYIIRALLLIILFAWALMNLDAVMKFLGKVISLFSPFLIGGGIAFLINVVLNPLERCWNKVCKKAPAKLARPVCLTLSAVLVFGILFAVVFMMIPSLRESGDEFIQNIPFYVDEIGCWWADTVHFAAKYNIVLPEYAIDSDLLIEKITTFINDEGSGIITVTWGAATSILSGLVDVLLAFVFALYLLAKKEVVAAHLKKLIATVFPQTRAKRLLSIASLTNQTFTNFVSGQLTEAVIIGVLCFFGMLILRIPYAGAVSTFVAVTALVPIFGAPTLKGELVYGIVFCSMPEMISPNLTASWEKGLTGVADGSISEGDYMKKLEAFVQQVVQRAKGGDYRAKLNSFYRSVQPHHAGENKKKRTTRKKKTTKA